MASVMRTLLPDTELWAYRKHASPISLAALFKTKNQCKDSFAGMEPPSHAMSHTSLPFYPEISCFEEMIRGGTEGSLTPRGTKRPCTHPLSMLENFREGSNSDF